MKCGTPVLQIKNKLRGFGIWETVLFAFTSQPNYYLDLQTICGSGNVACGDENRLLSFCAGQKFAYIVIGEAINAYHNPIQLIKCLSQLLNADGQMFLTLKNVQDIFFLCQFLGYPGVETMAERLSQISKVTKEEIRSRLVLDTHAYVITRTEISKTE